MPRSVWGQVYFRKDTGKWCLRYPREKSDPGEPTSYVCRTVGAGENGRKRAEKYLAEAHHRSIIGMLRNPKRKPGRTRRLTLAAAIEQFIDSVDRPRTTLQGYRRTLALIRESRIGRMPVTEVGPGDLEAWVKALPYKRSTKKTYLAPVSGALGWCVDQGILSESPMARVRRPRSRKTPPPVLSRDDIARFLAAMPPDLRAVMTATVLTGARAKEVLMLRWRDVDFDRGVVTITRTKTSNAGAVDLHPDLRAELLEHRARSGRVPHPNDLIWPPLKGGRPPRQIWKAMNRAREAAGLGGLGLTQRNLRHAFATYFLEQGGNPRRLQAILGHASLRTTETYSHLVGQADGTVSQLDVGTGQGKGEIRTAGVPAKRRRRKSRGDKAS